MYIKNKQSLYAIIVDLLSLELNNIKIEKNSS